MNKIGVIIAVSIFTLIGISAAVALINTSNNDQTSSSVVKDVEASTNGSSQVQSSANVNEVEINNFKFCPETITVKAGTTVTWTNNDTTQHDVKPDQESDAFRGSDLLARGDSYSFTFNTPGTYTYICSPHPYMKGTVIVE